MRRRQRHPPSPGAVGDTPCLVVLLLLPPRPRAGRRAPLGCWVAGWAGWPGGEGGCSGCSAQRLSRISLSPLSLPPSSSPLLSSPPALTSARHSCLVVRHQQWCCIAAAAIVEGSVAHGESRRDARPLPSPLSSLLSPPLLPLFSFRGPVFVLPCPSPFGLTRRVAPRAGVRREAGQAASARAVGRANGGGDGQRAGA